MSSDPAPADRPRPYVRVTGSLSRRMIFIASAWILLLLAGGGFALDRVLTGAITRNFDDQLDYLITSMMISAEIDDTGEVRFNRELADQRFFEPYSGLYWQVSGSGMEPFRSRSLWDRRLRVSAHAPNGSVHTYDSAEFTDEQLRIAERDVKLPGSSVWWRFQIAQSREMLNAQIAA